MAANNTKNNCKDPSPDDIIRLFGDFYENDNAMVSMQLTSKKSGEAVHGFSLMHKEIKYRCSRKKSLLQNML